MIKRENIEKFYRDVEKLDLRFPVAEIARETGEPKSNVSRYLSKKIEPSESFLNRFNAKFQNVIGTFHVAHSKETNTLNEPSAPYGNKKDLRMQALADLAQAEKMAEENKIISNNNRAKLIDELIAGEQRGNSVADFSILAGLLDVLAEIASGKQWHSKEEAVRELGRMLKLPDPVKGKLKGILSDAGK